VSVTIIGQFVGRNLESEILKK